MKAIPFYIFLFFFFFVNSDTVFSQPSIEKEPRILFLVDASGSMNLPWTEDANRFEAASLIITELMETAQLESNKISFGIRVFGAQYPAAQKNCFDTKLEVPFRYQNLNQVKARMKDIRPLGYSPIAYSLQKAAEEDFVDDGRYAYSLILITDGGESCDGDICAIMETLLSKKISFKPYIISLVNEGPLEELYHCLGDYSVVETPQDISNIVDRILIENKDILKIPNVRVRNRTPKPIQPTVQTPIQRLREETPQATTPPAFSSIPDTPTTMPVMISEPDPVRRTLKIRQIPFFLRLHKPPLANATPNMRAFQKPATQKLVVEEEPPVTTIVTHNPERPAQIPEPKERTPLKQATPMTEFFVTTEDADKTYVEIYFTNGQGKFYWTEPRIQVLNSEDKSELMTFNRHVNGQQPAKVEMEAGTYDFVIPNSLSSAPSVNIEANKINKIYIKIVQGSLAFYHPEDPKIAISQYTALVSKRFERHSPVVNHPCDEVLPYDPANYHIEINTLPPLVYNLDLDFTSIKLVAIPQPGYIEITNVNRVGLVEFWYRLGGRFVPFHQMMVTGNIEEQIREFLPGRYQVRYHTGPQHAGSEPNVVHFSITGKETTTIHLSR